MRTLPPAARTEPQSESSDVERFGLLMSIQPRFANAILEGTKTVELRRKPPRDQPEIIIIYGSGASKSVLGVAQLKEVHTSTPDDIWKTFGAVAGVTRVEFNEYFAGSKTASALELINPRRSGHYLPLTRLRELGLEPPQSWRYVGRQTAMLLLAALDLPSDREVRERTPRSWVVALSTALSQCGSVEGRANSNWALLRLIDSVCCSRGAEGKGRETDR